MIIFDTPLIVYKYSLVAAYLILTKQSRNSHHSHLLFNVMLTYVSKDDVDNNVLRWLKYKLILIIFKEVYDDTYSLFNSRGGTVERERERE